MRMIFKWMISKYLEPNVVGEWSAIDENSAELVDPALPCNS